MVYPMFNAFRDLVRAFGGLCDDPTANHLNGTGSSKYLDLVLRRQSNKMCIYRTGKMQPITRRRAKGSLPVLWVESRDAV